MPKITGHDVTYYGHEGVVEDAQGEKYQLDPVRDDAEVHPVGEPGQDPQEAFEQRAERRDNEQDPAKRTEKGVQDKSAQDKGGDQTSAGSSSKASSTQPAPTSTKSATQNR